MALFLSKDLNPNLQTIDIKDVFEQIEEAERFSGRDKWLYVASLMSRMTGEVEFVENFVKDLVLNREFGDLIDGYRDTSLVLGRMSGYAVRMNRWKPVGTRAIDVQSDIGLSYDLPHNHDFQLLTKGIWGPGYQTDVYQYDFHQHVGAHGEKVSLQYQGRYQLGQGCVIWFEEFSDVHIQHAPPELSLSLNFIPFERSRRQGQLFFDVKDNRVNGFPETLYANTLSLLDLLTHFSKDEEVFSIVCDMGSLSNNEWFTGAVGNLIANRWNMDRNEVFDILKFDIGKSKYASFSSDAFGSEFIRSS